MSRRCPTCGRGPTPSTSPARQVVTGQVGPDEAPVLFKLWETTLGLLREVGEVPQQQLAAVIAEACGASPTTVVNLLAAAHRAGLIRKRYATEGRPRRRRAYVRLPEPQETR